MSSEHRSHQRQSPGGPTRRVVLEGLFLTGVVMTALATGRPGAIPPAEAAPQKPADFVADLYKAAMGPKGDFSNGISIFADAKARQRFLSKKLRAALAAMDKRTPEGDAPDLDFDPVSASNDPDIHDLAVTTDSASANSANVIVKFNSHDQPVVLHYQLVLEDGGWKVDDIIAEEGDGWQVSKIIEGQ